MQNSTILKNENVVNKMFPSDWCIAELHPSHQCCMMLLKSQSSPTTGINSSREWRARETAWNLSLFRPKPQIFNLMEQQRTGSTHGSEFKASGVYQRAVNCREASAPRLWSDETSKLVNCSHGEHEKWAFKRRGAGGVWGVLSGTGSFQWHSCRWRRSVSMDFGEQKNWGAVESWQSSSTHFINKDLILIIWFNPNH